jgi:hypothetical protein
MGAVVFEGVDLTPKVEQGDPVALGLDVGAIVLGKLGFPGDLEVGKATSLDFVQAQRQLLMAREKQLETKAMLAQRLVELERSLGGTLPTATP